MSSASTDIISNNQLKDKTQGQESSSPQDTILDKANHDDPKDDVNIGADFGYQNRSQHNPSFLKRQSTKCCQLERMAKHPC